MPKIKCGASTSADDERTSGRAIKWEYTINDIPCDTEPIQISTGKGLQDWSKLRKPEYLNDYYVENGESNVELSAWCSVMSAETEPTMFYEAECMPDGYKWRLAMDKEMDSLVQNNT